MKHLLAYLFIVLGLGLTFNVSAKADNYCIPKKAENHFNSIYIWEECYVYHKKVDLNTFVEFALTNALNSVGVRKESPLFLEENLKWLKKYLRKNNISKSKINKSIKRIKIAKKDTGKTQNVTKEKSENLYVERMLTKQEKLDFAKGKIKIYKCSASTGTHLQKDDCIGDYYKKKLLPNKGLVNLYLLRDYTKTQIAKAEPSQTQKVVENSFICLNKKGDSYTPYFRSGPKCNKYNDIEVLERDEWYWVVRMPVSERSNPSYSKMMKIHHPKLFNSIMKNKNLIVKAEPSQTQKVAKKDIKFCVYKNSAYITNVTSEKYKITRFDNPYLTCDSNFIIDSNYKDELFYTYLVDTIGIVESRGFRTLEPVGNWKPKNPIKPKKKVKVAKVKPKQEEFKPKKTNQDNEAPVIEIAEAITVDSQAYTLKGKVKDKSQIYLTINGRQVDVKKGKFELDRFSIDPDVAEELKIVAIDQWNNKSEKIVKVTIDLQSTDIAKVYEELKPNNVKVKTDKNKIAIIIGIEKYENLTNLDAKYANRDAKAFRTYATRALGIKPSNIKVLIDDKATRSQALKAFKLWLPKIAGKGGKDIHIFFAGHGLASDNGEDLYILPQDGESSLLEDTAISRVELISLINKVNPRSVTMFFDTCYSGQTRDERMLVASLRPIRIVADEQETPDNFTIFTASNYDQTSGSIEEAEHGMFSYYLMKGLEGKADENDDRKITNGELIAYLKDNVSQEAFTQNREQDPMLAGDPDKILMSYR